MAAATIRASFKGTPPFRSIARLVQILLSAYDSPIVLTSGAARARASRISLPTDVPPATHRNTIGMIMKQLR